jgi:uncharacterized protein (DUF885 family)
MPSAATLGHRLARARGTMLGGPGRPRPASSLPAAPRQAREAATQAATWAGAGDDPAFFPRLVAGAAEVAGVTDRLIRDLTDAADAATTAYGDLATFLRDDYAPRATGTDAVGRDRYAMMAASFLGAEIDLDETYAWGWDQLRHVETELARVAEQVRPGAGIDATIEWLESGSDLAIEGGRLGLAAGPHGRTSGLGFPWASRPRSGGSRR